MLSYKLFSSIPPLQNKSYYIPGDAVVYGTMNNLENDQDGESIKIFGHGTLFGDKLPHPGFAEPPVTDDQVYTYHTIDIQVRARMHFIPCSEIHKDL